LPRFAFDPQRAVEHLQQADEVLAEVIARVGEFRMETRPMQSAFCALAEAIVYQQVTGKAAATIFGRVCDLFPGGMSGFTPERALEVTDDALRAAGLSRSKLAALRDLAERSADGRLEALSELEQLSDDAVIERLVAVRGIGRWTAQMFLMFRLGRADVLPGDDYGVRKGFAVAFKRAELPSRAEVEQWGERWKPFRTAASWYLWRASEWAPPVKKVAKKRAAKARASDLAKKKVAKKKATTTRVTKKVAKKRAAKKRA
jgi:3-methyladenine DNA glycosylase/8-oxoguanine DNA glycosylase